jgi:hypothetical protein
LPNAPPPPKPKKSKWWKKALVALVSIAAMALLGPLAGAIVGNIASQLTSRVLGLTHEFSWSQVGKAAVSALITPGFPGVASLNPVLKGLVNGATNYAANYVGSKAFGIETHFSWAGVGASVVGSTLGGDHSSILNHQLSILNDQLSSAATAYASDKWFGGAKPNYGDVAATALGGSLGYALGSSYQNHPMAESLRRMVDKPVQITKQYINDLFGFPSVPQPFGRREQSPAPLRRFASSPDYLMSYPGQDTSSLFAGETGFANEGWHAPMLTGQQLAERDINALSMTLDSGEIETDFLANSDFTRRYGITYRSPVSTAGIYVDKSNGFVGLRNNADGQFYGTQHIGAMSGYYVGYSMNGSMSLVTPDMIDNAPDGFLATNSLVQLTAFKDGNSAQAYMAKYSPNNPLDMRVINETLYTLGSGTLALSASGYGMIGSLGDTGFGRDIQKRYTYEPREWAAQEFLADTAHTLQPVGDAYLGARGAVGNVGYTMGSWISPTVGAVTGAAFETSFEAFTMWTGSPSGASTVGTAFRNVATGSATGVRSGASVVLENMFTGHRPGSRAAYRGSVGVANKTPLPGQADYIGPLKPSNWDALTSHPDGHAFTVHGGGVTDADLIVRARTGVKPNGQTGPIPPLSSAFYSDNLLIAADQAIRDSGGLQNAIARQPGQSVVRVETQDVGNLGVDLGYGYQRIGATGNKIDSLRSAQGIYELNPATGQWETITVYPAPH